MPLIRATIAGPASVPPALDLVRRERDGRRRLAAHPHVAHALLAAHVNRRPSRMYRAPRAGVVESARAHEAMKASDATFAAATFDRKPWTAAGAEFGTCAACGSSLMRVAGKVYGGAS